MRRVTKIATPIAHLVGPGKLKVINRQLAYATGDETPLRLDAGSLNRVLCYGDVGITDEALQVLFAHDIEVAFLSLAGQRMRGRIVRADEPRTSLRLVQYRVLQDPVHQREAAARMVLAKLTSQQAAALYYFRRGNERGRVVRDQITGLLPQCATASVEALRGVEGSASAAWFGLFAELLNPPWTFPGRVRRPPTDPINALLSLGYTFLLTRVRTRCEAFGLEVQLGALHAFRAGRPSLACDLMEPLRVPAVDRWVIAECNQGRLAPDEFEADPDAGGLRLTRPAFNKVLRLWEEHWLGGDLEAHLDQSIQLFISWLREQAGESLCGEGQEPSDDE